MAPLSAAFAFIVGSAQAQTWTNNAATGTYTWSTAGNWNTAAPVSGTSTIVNFFTAPTVLPTGTIIANNDLTPNPFVLNQLNINGTGGGNTPVLTINGNGIAFDGTSAQLNINPAYGSSGGYTVTLANALTFNTATAINFGNGGGFINMTGAWAGAGAVTFTGQLQNRALTLPNAGSTYTGNFVATGANSVVNLGGFNSGLGSNAANTQGATAQAGAGININYGNAAYTNNQNFIVSGNGNAGTANAALNITRINFGNGNIGGIATSGNATVRVNLENATENRGINLTRGLAGTGDLTKTGNGYIYTTVASAGGTWGGTAYSALTGNVYINEGVIQTASGSSNNLGSTATTVAVSKGAAFVHGASSGAWTNPQNFVLNGAGTGNVNNNLGGLAAYTTQSADFGSNVAGSLTIQTDSSLAVQRTTGRSDLGLNLTRGLYGNGILSLNTAYGASMGPLFIDTPSAATLTTAVGTFNSYSNKLVVNNGVAIIFATGSIGASTADQVYLSGLGGFGGTGTLNQALLSRIENRATTGGAIVLGANSSANLDFTNTPNLRLGSSGGRTYSGTLTPGANGYRLGGGGGTLTVSSNLTGGNSLNVSGAVTLTGTNDFTGGITIAGNQIGTDLAASLNFTGGTGALPANALTFSGTGGTFAYKGAAAGSSQSLGATSFADGSGQVTSTYGTSGNTALTLASLSRSAGATGGFTTSGGTNGTTNKISVTGLATGLVNKGVYFNTNDYAYNDASGFLRAPVYGTDPTFVTSGATTSVASATNQQITGVLSAQNTATFNTLKINGNAAVTLAASQILTVDGILKAGGSSDVTISGGNGIQASSGSEMVISTINTSSNSVTISNSILNNGGSSLTKTGAGTLTLSGTANAYTGGTTINQGTVVISSGNGLPDAGAVAITGGTLQLNIADTVGAVTLKNGVIAVNGTGRFNLTGTSFDLQNGQVNANLAGTANLVKNGTGLVTLTGTNAYTGSTTINDGSLVVLGNAARLPTATAVNITASGASLDFSGVTQTTSTIGSLTGVAGSTVRIGSQQLTVGDSNSTSFGGTIMGTTGTVTKVGSGTLTLAGSNTYTGATSVSFGTLVVGNGTSGSLASGSAVTVASGAIIAGNAGTIAGATSISGGGRLAPGNGTAKSIGTETFTGTLTFASTSIFDWDINSPSGADPGQDTVASNAGSYDKVINNNATKMSGSAVFNVILGTDRSFTDGFWNTDKKWDNVFSGSGVATNLSSIFSSFSLNDTILVGGLVPGEGTFGYGATGSTLTWTAVPEPTSALVSLLIGAGLLRRRRSAVC